MYTRLKNYKYSQTYHTEIKQGFGIFYPRFYLRRMFIFSRSVVANHSTPGVGGLQVPEGIARF